MYLLDIKTLFIMNLVILLILSLYLFSLYKKNKTNITIQYFLYFCTLYSVALFLFLLRNQISDFISMVIANTLFATANVSLYIAIRALFDEETQWKNRYWIPIFIVFIGFCIFVYFHYDANIRALIYLFFALFYALLNTKLFLFSSSSKFKVFDKVSFIFFLLTSILYISIIIRINFQQVETYYFSNVDIFISFINYHMLFLNLWIIIVTQYRIKKV